MNAEVCMEVHGWVCGGMQSCVEGYMEVCRGTQRCVEWYVEVHGDAWRYAEVCRIWTG